MTQPTPISHQTQQHHRHNIFPQFTPDFFHPAWSLQNSNEMRSLTARLFSSSLTPSRPPPKLARDASIICTHLCSGLV